MKKPSYVSHYLVLNDLIKGIDVREKVDFIHYLTSRIENIKGELVKEGIEFQEDITKLTKYSYYKPYVLAQSKENLQRAEHLLNKYATDEVLEFLEIKQNVA